MSDRVGFARLPGDVVGALGACTAAVAGCAAQVDTVLGFRGAALEEMAERRLRCAAAAAGLMAAASASRRAGPDRARLTELARAADRVAEAVDAAAWAWSRHDAMPEVADVLRALRDATRAVCRAAEALEHEDDRSAWDTRCREREAEARYLARAARGVLVAQEEDVRLAAAAQDVLTYAAQWLAAVTRMRTAVVRCVLE